MSATVAISAAALLFSALGFGLGLRLGLFRCLDRLFLLHFRLVCLRLTGLSAALTLLQEKVKPIREAVKNSEKVKFFLFIIQYHF